MNCTKRFTLCILILYPLFSFAQDQPFYFGNDLSYVNQMEDCGAVFREESVPKDPFKIFADRGTNLVRVRLWNDPSWWQAPLEQPANVNPYYNDFEDVKKTIRRARENGMEVMLDFHYSDFWADPGRQLVPRAWVDIAHDIEILKDSVYEFTTRVLQALDAEGLMPNIVKVGNENNGGILNDIPAATGFETASKVSTSWVRHAQLFNEAIRAVRTVSEITSIKPKIALHMSGNLSGQVWNFQNRFINLGVTDFDIIGISYYYAWHGASIGELESTIRSLSANFPDYEVMVAETGYLWTQQNFDALGNIINTPDPEYLPVTPEKQLEYMIDYTRAVMKGGGTGVIFWEPAWVSTPCRTPWGVGSSHDHVVFFDPSENNFMENGGGRWTERVWYQNIDAVKVTFRVDMLDLDTHEGVYIMADFLNEPVPLMAEENNVFYYYRYLNPHTTGSFYFLLGNDLNNRESVPAECADDGGINRPFQVSSENVIFNAVWSSCDPTDPDPQLFSNLTFKVDLTGNDRGNGAFITGAFTGSPWQIIPMQHDGDNIYSYTVRMRVGRTGAFHFLNGDTPENRETVPESCAPWWGVDRGYEVGQEDTEYFYAFGSCDETIVLSVPTYDTQLSVFPNPVTDHFWIVAPEPISSFVLFDLAGSAVLENNNLSVLQSSDLYISTQGLLSGIYILKAIGSSHTYRYKIFVK